MVPGVPCVDGGDWGWEHNIAHSWQNAVFCEESFGNYCALYVHLAYKDVNPFNCVVMGQAWFLFCTVFIYLFFSFVGDHYQTSAWPDTKSCNLWCLYAKNCWSINTWESLRILFSL